MKPAKPLCEKMILTLRGITANTQLNDFPCRLSQT